MTDDERRKKRAEYMRKWQAAHPGYNYAYIKKRREADPDIRRREYERTRDACIARANSYAKANPEKVSAYERKRYAEDPERKQKTIARANARRIAHPDLRRAEDRKYREAHKEEIAAYNAEYSKEHPEVARQYQHRRRAQMYGSAASRTVNGPAIFEACKWICQLCGKKVNKRLKYPNPMSPSLDHIIPLSQGGAHVESNCQLAHLSCNKKKNAAPAPLGEQIRIQFAA